MEYARTKLIIWDGAEVPVVDMDAMRAIAQNIQRVSPGSVFHLEDESAGRHSLGVGCELGVSKMLREDRLKELEVEGYLVLIADGWPVAACDAWM